jgi:hypothetical protein
VSNSSLNIFLNFLFLYSLPFGHNPSLIHVIRACALKSLQYAGVNRVSYEIWNVSSNYYPNPYSFSFFFPMMARRGPFRVLALV